MKYFIAFVVTFSLSVYAQVSSKSIETPQNMLLNRQQAETERLREEQASRIDWDRKEATAEEREEVQREIDEQRAEGFEPTIIPSRIEQQQETKEPSCQCSIRP